MGKRYTQLSIEERTRVRTELGMGLRPAVMTRSLDRSASTLARKLRTEGIGWLCLGHARHRPRAHGQDRRVSGHWEGDLIKGAHNRPAVGTRVENARAEEHSKAQATRPTGSSPQSGLSLTCDQGWEGA